MADTAVVESVPAEAVTKDLKEKKEVVEEPEKAENGSGDAPANGTEENGADHADEKAKDAEEPAEKEDKCDGEKDKEAKEEDKEVKEDSKEEPDHPVKRAAEEEEKVETKKQKTENGDSTEVEASA